MNGTAQTMDLVQCLAMVAQNELGSSAPAEAYKANVKSYGRFDEAVKKIDPRKE